VSSSSSTPSQLFPSLEKIGTKAAAAAAGVGEHEQKWLGATAAVPTMKSKEKKSMKGKGSKEGKGGKDPTKCWLRCACVKVLEGPVLQVAQLSNHLAVAQGPGVTTSNNFGGASSLVVFKFTLLSPEQQQEHDDNYDGDHDNENGDHSDIDDKGASASSSSSSAMAAAAAAASFFHPIMTRGSGAMQGGLDQISFFETPRLSFITSLRVRIRMIVTDITDIMNLEQTSIFLKI
jgi:hypothetical protein